MIVIPAVLVVQPYQQRILPPFAVHDRFDHFGREGYAQLDILWVLFREVTEVRINDAEMRQGPVRGILEELVQGLEVLARPQESHRVQSGGALNLPHDEVTEERQEQPDGAEEREAGL